MMDETELQKSLTDRNQYFNQMVNLIPARFYFSNEDKQHIYHGKESLGKIPHHKVQKLNKKKKQKLDPAQLKTVTGIQGEIAEKEERERRNREEQESALVIDDVGSDDEIDTDEPNIPIKPISVEKIICSESIEELREKLNLKIANLKKKRNMVDNTNNDIPKKLKKLSLEKQKKEKWDAIKKSKAEMRKARNGKLSVVSNEQFELDEPTAPPVLTSEGEVAFSKFEFTKSSDKKKKWVKANAPRSNRDYTRLLMKAKMNLKKMKELEEKDPEKAKEAAENQAWKKALMKAQGTKVKDDPELIKKSMKKQEKVRERSAKKWKERIEQQEKVKKDKQDKRNKNIQSRKSQKQMKKVKRLQKKGKLLPGF